MVIAHKRAIFARVYFNSDICEHSLVELKHIRHLHVNHAYQVQELNEDGTPLLILVVFVVVAEPPRKLMAEREPLFLNQLLEASDCTVSAIEQDLSEGSQLGRPVPPVSAVNENVIFMIYDSVHDVVYSCKNVGGQVHILGIFDSLEIFLRVVKDIGLAQVIHLLHSVSYCVNIIDITELDLNVGIILRVLDTSALNSVGVGSCPRTSIKYHQLVSWVIDICAAYF